jgi:hypothetical protein
LKVQRSVSKIQLAFSGLKISKESKADNIPKKTKGDSHPFGQIRDDRKDKKTAQVIDIREAISLKIQAPTALPRFRKQKASQPPDHVLQFRFEQQQQQPGGFGFWEQRQRR